MANIRHLFRVHFDVPAVVVIVGLVLILRYPTARALAALEVGVDIEALLGTIVGQLVLAVISAILTGAILLLCGFAFLRLRWKLSVVGGRFTAFEGASPNEVEWGFVQLNYNIFSNRIRGSLKSKDGKTKILIEGFVDKEFYLRATYYETTNPARRRLGAILLKRDGHAEQYLGYYVYVSPFDGCDSPQTECVRWARAG